MLIHRGLLMELLEVSRNRKPIKRYSHIFTTSLVRELHQKMPVGSIHLHRGWWIIRLLPDEHDCRLGTYPVHQDMQSYATAKHRLVGVGWRVMFILQIVPWVTKDRGLWFLENLTERFQEEIQHDEPWHFTAKTGCWLFLPRVDLLHPS